MANKHTERCSTSLVISKIPIKTAMRYHYIPITIYEIKKKEEVEEKEKKEKERKKENKLTIPNTGKKAEQLEISYFTGGNAK